MSALIRRLDRLDGGRSGRVEDMTDDQLLRVIARELPDPAAFLRASPEEQERVMVEIINSEKETTNGQ